VDEQLKKAGLFDMLQMDIYIATYPAGAPIISSTVS
jgi:hypothetical protein